MTFSSMTGFARDEGSHGAIAWTWEIKSVNGRGLELRCRLPAGYDAIEIDLRRRLSARVSRGSLNIALHIHRSEAGAGVAINDAALAALIAAAGQYANHPGVAPARIDGLFAIPGVVESMDALISDDERTAREAALLQSFDRAVENLLVVRRAEGATLKTAITGLIDHVESLTAAAAACAGAQPQMLKARFAARVQDFLSEAQGLSAERIAQEVALLAAKADVREEIDRLNSHVGAARTLLASNEPVGRKFDFLAQEFNREANTLCSKAQDMDLTRVGLEMKNAIGQFREQIQNIE